uniref:adenylyl cyclase-associated protein 1 isoform X1 n=1 Tax=Ciona intestinalis TaxID=7719 RepID=UPI00089DB341|nr:adenylyl cyclase-associated protein 1 isoform X1 [Ciona intestinalis]|eukprot:XP_026696112.1 adenylyl cyclase-associated protein 1 isoform X1 [Ciona intestinalis]
MATAELASLVSRLETVVKKLESNTGGSGDAQQQQAKFIEAYDEFVTEYVDPYLAASAVLGAGDMADQQAKLFKEICGEMKKFLLIVSKYGPPANDSVIMALAKNMSTKMGAMNDLKSKLSRKSDQKNHMLAACEGVSVFGWIGYPKAPKKFVKESKESVKFYTNKVLTETKTGDKATEHKNWVNAFVNVFDGLHDYIHEYHTTGPSWNASNVPSCETLLSSKPQLPPKPGYLKKLSDSSPDSSDANDDPPLLQSIPPPPPPPPPPSIPGVLDVSKADAAPLALFAEINSKGTGITGCLKKVTNDMKTHKNPDLRKHHAPVPYKASNSGYKPVTKAKPAAAKKPPVLRLEGKKWVVENQENAADLKIENVEMFHTVYVYRCNNSVLTINEKVNSIVLDSCKKVGLVFTSVVSGVEVINCQSVKVQCQGQMPTVSIDKTDGCIVYLSNECLNCEIVTAKSSEMNISVPREDGDFDEFPIVEQFRTIWNPDKKTFITTGTESI